MHDISGRVLPEIYIFTYKKQVPTRDFSVVLPEIYGFTINLVQYRFSTASVTSSY